MSASPGELSRNWKHAISGETTGMDAQRLADCREHATRKADINDGPTHRDCAAGGDNSLRIFMTVRSHLASYIPPGRAARH